MICREPLVQLVLLDIDNILKSCRTKSFVYILKAGFRIDGAPEDIVVILIVYRGAGGDLVAHSRRVEGKAKSLGALGALGALGVRNCFSSLATLNEYRSYDPYVFILIS